MSSLVVIPARFASVRFPGKPLVLIDGKPMIEHVYSRCKTALGVADVIVATEDERIRSAVEGFGGKSELTSSSHVSGTDRVAEVAERHPEFRFVLNVQGDEPAIEPETVGAVINALVSGVAPIATAATPLTVGAELNDPNVVKAVLAESGLALYFSRSPVPFMRNADSGARYLRHLGIYGFQRETLLKITKLTPSPLERAESLEQLRWLEAGIRIHCAIVESNSFGIDVPSDLDKLMIRTSKTLST